MRSRCISSLYYSAIYIYICIYRGCVLAFELEMGSLCVCLRAWMLRLGVDGLNMCSDACAAQVQTGNGTEGSEGNREKTAIGSPAASRHIPYTVGKSCVQGMSRMRYSLSLRLSLQVVQLACLRTFVAFMSVACIN